MNDTLILMFLYAVPLSFIVIITKGRRIDIPFKIEYFLKNQGCTVLAKPIRAVTKLFTTADEKEKQMKSIHAWIETKRDCSESYSASSTFSRRKMHWKNQKHAPVVS